MSLKKLSKSYENQLKSFEILKLGKTRLFSTYQTSRKKRGLELSLGHELKTLMKHQNYMKTT